MSFKKPNPLAPSLQGNGENSKPLPFYGRGLERGFLDAVKSKESTYFNHQCPWGREKVNR